MENVGLNDSARASSRTWFGRRGAGTPVADPAPPPVLSAPPAQDFPSAPLVIDALGRKCPIPIIMLAEQIRDVSIGEIVALLADDPAAFTDIPAWCQMKSHDLAYRESYRTGWAFGLKRNY
jgi:tRNA 2-thiouridine synthesizing protein A